MTAVGGVLAVTEANLVAIVVVIVSAIVGPLVVAKANERAKRIEERLGEPNGHGNVVQMMERLLAGQTGQDARLAQIEGRLHRGDERMGRLGAKVSDLSERVAKIETSCQFIAEHVHDDDEGVA